jgi:hypothetical protein
MNQNDVNKNLEVVLNVKRLKTKLKLKKPELISLLYKQNQLP